MGDRACGASKLCVVESARSRFRKPPVEIFAAVTTKHTTKQDLSVFGHLQNIRANEFEGRLTPGAMTDHQTLVVNRSDSRVVNEFDRRTRECRVSREFFLSSC